MVFRGVDLQSHSGCDAVAEYTDRGLINDKSLVLNILEAGIPRARHRPTQVLGAGAQKPGAISFLRRGTDHIGEDCTLMIWSPPQSSHLSHHHLGVL